ncbi:hypothetical protein BCR39DRAFT_152313 [Naematelia encephala]|uniref:Uncharacterized protein n=1 Tax=Naematelia encephala TaxID=71784 RepID=A0A1Y2B784_9TREE|nr:hypothetical protein BCR39DRAFT_152313 [Naematelia encephala]
MEHSFALPTPAFSRRGRGVVMPKRRAEVVADRQRRMSRQHWDERLPPRIFTEEEQEAEAEADQSLDTVLEESESSTSSTSELFVKSEFLANEGIPPLLVEDVELSTEKPLVRSDTPTTTTYELEVSLEAGEVDLPPSRITSPSPPRRLLHNAPVASSSSPTSIYTPVRIAPASKAPIAANNPELEQLPTVPPLTKPFKRKPRSQSLTSALAAKVHPIIPDDEEPPSVPALGPLRKQKSLKKFFFPDTDQDAIPPVPPVPDRERRSRGLLSRAKSKPSLRIDIKASRAVESAVPTPVLSASSERLPDTPPVKTPGLSKRFSLSNMSLAFKKARSASNAPVPRVPDLPDVYRKDRDGKGIIKASAVPLGPKASSIPEPTALSSDVQPAMQVGLMDPITLKSDVRIPQYPSLPSSPITSIEEGEDDDDDMDADDLSDELTHAQLMHISPRTRLDPAASPALQEHVGRAVAPCTVVQVEGIDRRESLRGLIGLELEFGISMFDGTLQSVAELQGGSESDSSLDTVDNEPVTPNPSAIPLSRRIDTPTHTGSPASLVAPTPTSTPRSRFPSPEAFLRKFGSPRSTKSQIATYTSGRESRDSPRSALATVIPLPPPDMSEVDNPFSSLTAHVQLKSLHFDSLDLDFGGFHFKRDPISASATST